MFPSNGERAPSLRLANEDVDLLRELRKRLSFKPSLRQLQCWCYQGVRNRFTGERIFLETIMLPIGRATSIQAVARFLVKINEQPKPRKKKPGPKRTPKKVA